MTCTLPFGFRWLSVNVYRPETKTNESAHVELQQFVLSGDETLEQVQQT
jgi:hypothetical protein